MDQQRGKERLFPIETSVRLEPVTVRGRPLATGDRVRGPTVATPPLRKLLFSATLTSNPQKLAGLDVINPLMYTTKEMRAPAATARSRKEEEEDRVARRDEETVEGAAAHDESALPRQKTWRSNLDDVEAGADAGRYSTPASLEEVYTVCTSQVRLSDADYFAQDG